MLDKTKKDWWKMCIRDRPWNAPGWNTERNERETYMEQRLQSILNKHYGKNLDTATDQEVYTALMLYTKEQLAAMPRTEGKRKLYYVSAEFLIGKLLSNNLINLGLFDEAKELLAKHGHELTAVEEAENEPSLGNGGLAVSYTHLDVYKRQPPFCSRLSPSGAGAARCAVPTKRNV